ncbi:MAG: hypothetical protein U0X73_12700 [Thermoanaerobaculia bacterium]
MDTGQPTRGTLAPAFSSFALCLAVALLATFSSSARAVDTDPSDTRPAQGASVFVGSAIDNFAAGELRSYLNPDASSDVRTFERLIGGLQFSWRLYKNDARQLWFYGWTVHGVRSADVNCAESPDLEVCKGFENTTDPTGRFLYIVRNASSLEAAGGLRWEFARLGGEDVGNARLFASAQLGMLTVTGTGGDVLQQSHLGLGLVAPTGRLQESYIEVGFGQSDLFEVHAQRRIKINGFLTWAPRGWNGTVRGFARIVVDADFGKGADSVQSYFGLRFDVERLFSKAEPVSSSSSTEAPSKTPEPGASALANERSWTLRIVEQQR